MILLNLIKDIAEPKSFVDRGVDNDDIEKILETARLAPSANNSQIWRFFVVKDRGLLKEVSALSKKESFQKAPLIICALTDPAIVSRRGREQPFFMIDVPIAMSHIVLMAKEIGISASLDFEIDEGRLKEIIKSPKSYRAVALIALGYASRHLPKSVVDKETVIRRV
jgi:nitroreductase